MRCKDRRRLVQDEDVRLAVEGLDDLHPLLYAHRKIVDVGIGVNVQAVLVGQLTDSVGCPVPVEEQTIAPGFVAQHDVLGHGQRGDEHEMLVHHADALGNGVVGAVDVGLAAVEEDLAFVRGIETVQSVHQGGLSCPVFPQEGVDFPLLQCQVNVVVGQHAREGLGNTAQVQY